MNYVVRYKDTENSYLYASMKIPRMEFVFTNSILDAYFFGERKYASNGVRILKDKYPDLKFQILAV